MASSDARLELAYAAILASLEHQDSTLANIRNRATGVLSATTIAITVAASVGLFDTSHSATAVPTWSATLLFVGVFAIGCLAVFVLWPVSSWTRGASAQEILGKCAEGCDVDATRRFVINDLEGGRVDNEGHISHCAMCLQFSAVLLVAEFVVLGVGLATR